MDLSVFRKRRSLTQLQLARQLGVDQSTVSRMEKGESMFVSSLLRYLSATGAEGTRIVTTIDGEEVELELLDTPTARRSSHRTSAQDHRSEVSGVMDR
jgi:transcriptional regulator with XRE-family HTH domain